MDNLGDILEQAYASFYEKKFANPCFDYTKLLDFIQKKETSKVFRTATLGHSFLEHPIIKMEFGKGTKKVMLWSRMHGNEPTSTMALTDIINFLTAKSLSTSLEQVREVILDRLSILWIPTVNPDGAENFCRYNAQSIDINRDYLSQISPEAQLLRRTHEEFKPEFGFNLHDQDILWGVKSSEAPACISLLAPAYDCSLELNEVRTKAVQVCVGIYNNLFNILPENIGRYKDDFEPRAFGDNFQAQKSSTILIESGGYYNDENRDMARKCNFIAILTALFQIATDAYQKEKVEDYFAIPPNEKNLFFIKVRNVEYKGTMGSWKFDIGINFENISIQGRSKVKRRYFVEQIGDVHNFGSYHQVDAQEVEIQFSKQPYVGECVLTNWQKDRLSRIKFK